MLQEGKSVTKAAAMAKLFCSELAMRATIKAVQVHDEIEVGHPLTQACVPQTLKRRLGLVHDHCGIDPQPGVLDGMLNRRPDGVV